ncbi:hypothetical protein O1L68_27880 [Streptomyces lydicus]|nr:hypothetical protein [Streptomyces lydicus]
MSTAPRDLRPDLAAEVRPWAEQLARYGSAGVQAVDTLMAQAHDDGDAAWRPSARRSGCARSARTARRRSARGAGPVPGAGDDRGRRLDRRPPHRPDPGDGAGAGTGERDGRTSLTVPSSGPARSPR